MPCNRDQGIPLSMCLLESPRARSADPTNTNSLQNGCQMHLNAVPLFILTADIANTWQNQRKYNVFRTCVFSSQLPQQSHSNTSNTLAHPAEHTSIVQEILQCGSGAPKYPCPNPAEYAHRAIGCRGMPPNAPEHRVRAFKAEAKRQTNKDNPAEKTHCCEEHHSLNTSGWHRCAEYTQIRLPRRLKSQRTRLRMLDHVKVAHPNSPKAGCYANACHKPVDFGFLLQPSEREAADEGMYVRQVAAVSQKMSRYVRQVVQLLTYNRPQRAHEGGQCQWQS